MALATAEKQKILQDHARGGKDTGSPEVQIALLTEKINRFNEHIKKHIHDFGSKRGLLIAIGQRKRLLQYLSKKNPKRYESVLKKLGLRK